MEQTIILHENSGVTYLINMRARERESEREREREREMFKTVVFVNYTQDL